MSVLVVNSGSSSIKFRLFATRVADVGETLLEGEIQRIGGDAHLRVRSDGEPNGRVEDRRVRAANHHEGFGLMIDALGRVPGGSAAGSVDAVGHRVVHGGQRFTAPTLIDDEVVSGIEDVRRLAPLHNGPNLAGIEAARAWLPEIPQVAVFDTAFHSTLPPAASTYALPRQLAAEHGIRRYGFHGTSHQYVAKRAAHLLGRPLGSLDLITLHLGNGASATAIHAGRSVDTSMGMTPLEGLVMGTRCGDLDPSIPLLLSSIADGEDAESTRSAIDAMLNNDSGLKGLTGAGDMRDVHRLIAEGDADAELALDVFCYRLRKYIGAYHAALGRADAVVFTAGIGEHDAEVRSRSCAGLSKLEIEIDESRNRREEPGERAIHRRGSEVAVLVIPTNEELEIALQTWEVAKRHRRQAQPATG